MTLWRDLVFVLNVGVSFTITAVVALRAYDVSLREQLSILRFLCREVIKSSLRLVWPLRKANSPRWLGEGSAASATLASL